MDFKTERPIYQQIIDLVYASIAEGRWREPERIPSVREFAAQLQVNPNTVMRAYERLQATDVIVNRRGIGFFVAVGAKEQVLVLKRKDFFEVVLPELFAAMQTLEIDIREVLAAYKKSKGINATYFV